MNDKCVVGDQMNTVQCMVLLPVYETLSLLIVLDRCRHKHQEIQ